MGRSVTTTYHVAGTPLESAVWQGPIGKVRLRWRDVPRDDIVRFLNDLISAAMAERKRLFRLTIDELGAQR
jgi:hypothetical protein